MTIKTKTPPVSFIHIPVMEHDVKGLLCSAYDSGVGGSLYWMSLQRVEYLPGLTAADFKDGGKLADGDFNHPVYTAPLTPGCALIIVEHSGDNDESVEHRLDLGAIQRGIQAIVKYPHHISSIVEDNCDADTGDAFLQLCLFGEIKYG